MRRGYYDKEGEWIEKPDVAVALWPELRRHGLYCINGHYQKLLPVSRDYEAHSWNCNCKCITLEAIHQCFDNCRETFRELYKLKTLSYSVENNSWEIVSAEFIGDSRVSSYRKTIGPTEREEILSNLKQSIEDSLGVTFESFGVLLQS